MGSGETSATMEKKLEAQKELDAESMTTVSVNVKEYAPSEAFSAEPPPVSTETCGT